MNMEMEYKEFLANLSKEELIKLTFEFMKDKLTQTYKRDILDYVDYDKYIVTMIDVNGLKQINDNEGHDAGDNFISDIAKEIKKNIREDDILIRYGGDEFLVLFKNTRVKFIDTIMKRLNHVSYGIGYSLDLKDAIRMADLHMYRNKRKYYEEKNKE